MRTATVTLNENLALDANPDRVSLRNWVAVLGALLGAFMAVLDIQITNSSLQDMLDFV